MALVGLGLLAAGGILSGVSAGNSAAYQAEVARQNAKIAQGNEGRAAMATSQQTEQAGLEARSKDAAVRAGAAANGVDVNSGSAADVQESQRELGQIGVANTAERGALETYGYGAQTQSDYAQANLEQSQVIPDYLGGGLKGAGSLLSGAPNADVSSLYSWMTPGNIDTSNLSSLLLSPGADLSPSAPTFDDLPIDPGEDMFP